MSSPTYASREDVKAVLESLNSARNDTQIDDALAAGTEDVDALLHRFFFPLKTTRTIDNRFGWLGEGDELITLTSLTDDAGELAVAADYDLEPTTGSPPFDRIANYAGPRPWTVVGLFGYRDEKKTLTAVTTGVNSSVTTLDVDSSTGIGVGDLIETDTERLTVTARTMKDTGVNASALTASKSDVAITLSTATLAPAVGELILIGSERMRVVDLAGLTATVLRAQDGTVLAAHSAGSDIHAPRTLTVERAARGTTAAAHLAAAVVSKVTVPALVKQLCLAETINTHLQVTSGYARTVGSGDNVRNASGVGLDDIRRRAFRAHGRPLRVWSV